MSDKSKKLYGKSPSVGKDKDGKAELKKPTEASMEDMDLAGSSLPGNAESSMPVQMDKDAERKSMHKRHEEEQHSMHERHEKDVSEMHKRHEKAMKSGTEKPETKKENE